MNEQLQKRIEAMQRSRELGRCECSLPYNPFPCPCRYMRDKQICHCAGEPHPEHTQHEWAEYNLGK